jgi:hypothetical protein
LADAVHQIEDITKRCNEAENEKNSVLREKGSYQMQIEEFEEQLAEVLTDYQCEFVSRYAYI